MIINGNGKKNKLFGNAENDNINGLGGNDQLSGGAGQDSLFGGAGKDILFGDAGHDVLDGGAGKDKLFGGTGDDTYVVSLIRKGSASKGKATLEDQVSENAGEGTDTLTLTGNLNLKKVTTLTLQDNFENLDISQTGVTKLNITGNAAGNILTGNAFGNVIDGGVGNDELKGGAGADTLTGGAGEDVFVLNFADIGTADTITDFNVKDDTIQLNGFAQFSEGFFTDMFALNAANDANDYLIYNQTTGSLFFDADGNGAGAQVLIANLAAGTTLSADSIKYYVNIFAGNASTTGTSSEDSISGGMDNDAIDGGAGDDGIFGDIGSDTLKGSMGNDVLDGGNDEDILLGDGGNDSLYGGDGGDYLWGGSDNDSLDGGTGFDILFGSSGADILTGGADQDIFVFASISDSPVGAGHDVITDFSAAETDLLYLYDIDANTTLATDQVFNFIGNNVAFTGAAGELRFDTASQSVFGDVNGDSVADFQIELLNVTSMTAGDFIL